MAVTTEYSTQYANTYITKPPVNNKTIDIHGRMRIAYFEFTQGAAAGDAGSFAYMVTLPAGNNRLLLPLSRLAFSAWGTARTMDLGWLAYTDLSGGTAVAADPNGLDDGVDVSSAGSVNPGGTIGTHETKQFDSQGVVTLTAQCNDGTLPAAGTLSGYWIYVHD